MERISRSFRSRSYGKLDPQMPKSEEQEQQQQLEKKKKSHKPCIIITASSLILIAVAICLVLSFIHFHKKHSHSALSAPGVSQGSAGIRAVCDATLFPDTCIQDLSANLASRSANPRELVVVGVKAALQHVQNSFHFASNLPLNQSKGLESQATQDCLELLDDAKDQLNASISQLSTLKLSSLPQQLTDVKVWLSTSLSYQTACTDGFYNQSGKVTDLMLNNQENVSRSLANSLYLVDILSNLAKDVSNGKKNFPSFHFRRLLSDRDTAFSHELFLSEMTSVDGFPSWVSATDRKLLQVNAIPAPSATPATNATPATSGTTATSANAVVAKDGSGKFTTIQDAVNAIPIPNTGRYVIYIKKGIYNEVVSVTKKQMNVMFVGDGIGNTIITGNRNVAGSDFTTFRSATVAITGQGFMAKGITFQNTAGPSGHQAVALRVGADHVIFDACSFEGYQDTLYAVSSRQFFRSCQISGTVDYIFGNAIAIFQDCKLLARQPLPSQKNTYTAHGRKVPSDPSGFSFQNCIFTGEAGLQASVQNYLGRPWKPYARTVILKSQLDSVIDPAGWLPWEPTNAFGETVYYGEYANIGAGANIATRVTWGGVHSSMSLTEAEQFSVENFISGTIWLPAANVEYDASISE